MEQYRETVATQTRSTSWAQACPAQSHSVLTHVSHPKALLAWALHASGADMAPLCSRALSGPARQRLRGLNNHLQLAQAGQAASSDLHCFLGSRDEAKHAALLCRC